MRNLARNCNMQPSGPRRNFDANMKTRGTNPSADFSVSPPWPMCRQPASRPGHMQLVSTHEMEDLRDELARGNVPPDLEAKLRKLALSELGHRFIEQNCRTMIALLQAASDGSFKEADEQEFERLLRVLAYVRKDDDAIPDYRPDGFADDQQEVRAATTDLSRLLQTFKAWRLRHQVPAMWAPRFAAHPVPEPLRGWATAGRSLGYRYGS